MWGLNMENVPKYAHNNSHCLNYVFLLKVKLVTLILVVGYCLSQQMKNNSPCSCSHNSVVVYFASFIVMILSAVFNCILYYLQFTYISRFPHFLPG